MEGNWKRGISVIYRTENSIFIFTSYSIKQQRGCIHFPAGIIMHTQEKGCIPSHAAVSGFSLQQILDYAHQRLELLGVVTYRSVHQFALLIK